MLLFGRQTQPTNKLHMIWRWAMPHSSHTMSQLGNLIGYLETADQSVSKNEHRLRQSLFRASHRTKAIPIDASIKAIRLGSLD